MQVGKLDQRVTFETLVETDDSGSLVQTWAGTSPPDTVFAEVLSQRGGESFEAARVNARETVRVRVRYRSDITTNHRLVWRSQNYSIKYVDHSARRDGYLWLTAELNGAP